MKLRGKLVKKMLQTVGGVGGITFSVLSCIFMFKNILFLSNNIGMIQVPMVLKYLSFAMAGLVGVEIGAFIGLPLLQDLFYEEHKFKTYKSNKNNNSISNNKSNTLEDKSLKKENVLDKKEKIDSLEALKQELLNCKIDEEEQDKEEKLVRIKR